ncbi:acyltransferase [Butyrivibrio sp. INlla16]|uniref:acyltransferase family protein n=1 Tax=Butyrivibrio sp. INlla16 TaxID=1520807 RepID=UPI00088EB845|nr:acyltransferase [Butyrivibrio sp. INlla16]SDB68445.1 Fucose 4-O-acetylase [Butyrivibrio sp. INlla16]
MKAKMNTIKNSLGMFDLIKGVIMILMILGHTQGLLFFLGEADTNSLLTSTSPFLLFLLLLLSIIRETAMPILLIICGYGFRKTTNIKCVKKQFTMLLIPYAITMLITTVMHLICYYVLYRNARSAVKATLSVFSGGLLGFSHECYILGLKFSACGPIWFLLALAIAYIIFNFGANLFEKEKLFCFSIFICLLGWLISYIDIIPWSISQGFISVFYISLGYFIKKNKLFTTEQKNIYKVTFLIIALILKIIVLLSGSLFDMANNMYPLGPISIAEAGIWGIIIVFLFLHLNNITGTISTFIRRIGRNSLYVLCIHSIELLAFSGYYEYDLAQNWQGSVALRCILVFCVRLAFVLICTFSFTKIKDTLK